MTLKEAILKSLENLKTLLNSRDVLNNISENNYYDFGSAKAGVSALLGDFIRNNDTRVKRIKSNKSIYFYYLAKYEQDINFEAFENCTTSTKEETKNKKELKTKKTYQERDLHKLFSTYLNSKNIHSKTILHEESKNSKDEHQKWIHPDMIGIEFLNLTSEINKAFMKILNKADTFKLTSYELKKEINTDFELKKCYFQAGLIMDI